MSEKIENAELNAQAMEENVVSEHAVNALNIKPKIFTRPMMILMCFCCVGFSCSSLYGFDASLMSSLLIMPTFQNEFNVGAADAKAGYITAMFQIGSVCAIPFIGVVLDKLGRRSGILLGCSIVVIGVILQGTASIHSSVPQYLAGRFFVGFGSALATQAAPSYVVEIAHPSYRGVMSGMLNCTFDVGGILASGVSRAAVKYQGNKQWLLPTWIQMLFAGIVCITAPFIPESPRWHYSHGQKQKAIDFLTKYHGMGDVNNPIVQLEIVEFEESLGENQDMKWWDYREVLKKKGDGIRLVNCLTLAIFDAWTGGGINNYMGKFYESAGITNPTTVLNFNLGYSFYAAANAYFGASLCNRVNRRTLMLTGLSGIVMCWMCMTIGTARYFVTGSTAAARLGIASYFIFSTFYGLSLTPLCGLYPYEVLSYRQRAKGASLYILVNSIGLLVNQFGTPVAMQNLGWKTYLIYNCWCVLEVIWAFFTMTETRGYTLEELDTIYLARNPVKESLKLKKELPSGAGVVLGVVRDDTEIIEKLDN